MKEYLPYIVGVYTALVFIGGAAFGIWLQCWFIRRSDRP